jgi:hypothetical protein
MATKEDREDYQADYKCWRCSDCRHCGKTGLTCESCGYAMCEACLEGGGGKYCPECKDNPKVKAKPLMSALSQAEKDELEQEYDDASGNPFKGVVNLSELNGK